MAKSADAFRTISEVAEWLGVQTHVLRFWESKFTQVKPVKRAGGRRYYRPVDMKLLGGIQKLLHEDGLTIKGVQKILREKGMAHVSALSPEVDGVENTADTQRDKTKPAPFEKNILDDFGSITADVLPFAPEPRKPEPKKIEPVDRPSFTQDAVVMPDVTPVVDDDAAPISPEPTAPTDNVAKQAPVAPVDASPPTHKPQDVAPGSDTPEIRGTDDIEAASADVDVDPQDPISNAADTPVKFAETAVPEQPTIEPDAKAQKTPDAADQEPFAVLPAFLSRATRLPPATDNLPPVTEITTGPQPTGEPAQAEAPVEAPKLKPAIVDVPDTPGEAEMPAAPRALSALAKVKSLTPAQAAAIAPLLAQLRDVRDRMSTARKE